ncbi:MAG TPA: ethylbenzene dehydrogenase-related protein [Albitalea sp.]|nr:ethylbenzene dehydrogenase-related protein [Albitalea sp.]
MKKSVFATVIGVAVLAMTGCQTAKDQAAPNTLVAAKASAAPDLNAGAADPAWAKARALTVPLTDGANFGGKGETAVTLKAVYSADMLYMLVQYADPTHSVRRGPYQKQADGSWKKLKDPADKGGDDNVYYEDKWAMIWPIDNSIKAFDKEGCAAMCHKGQDKPFGNKYTATAGEIGDIWHMKGDRTAPWGFIDDQYVDHTRYDPKASPNAGRKSDPGTATGEYNAFPLVDGKPQFMNRDAKAANAGGTYYIKRGDEVPFDDSKFKPGDEVASFIINPLQGDRGDIHVAVTWKDGVYTSVVSRKLVTGSKYDVQFSNLGARYGFGFAAFDNAQVRHATPDDPLYLVFGK